ncbi:DMBT1-like protein [Mya arenaria]|uniref:DMBT1-like protein n=1 Tax=Mya arenaria TaxID=6604 RepID=A0ABY7FZL3_MYAAR|nr:deleted in malignant brain tumors 1 protein-like [Mya arenaria]WAR27655.1 DMBT1-like protein [Mya arenaria]
MASLKLDGTYFCFLVASLTMNIVTGWAWWEALVAGGKLGCHIDPFLTNTSGSIGWIYQLYGPPVTCGRNIIVPHGRYICINPIRPTAIFSLSVFDTGIKDKSSVLIVSLQGDYDHGETLGICSESNSMTIEFTVDGYLSASYFTQETASVSPQSCGGTFVERNGSLRTPNYPSSFNPNQACLYNISVPGVLSVCLEIEYIYDVRLVLEVTKNERSNSSRDSAGTKVTSYRINIQKKGTWCSQNNKMVVYQMNRPYSKRAGFRATYRSLLREEAPNGLEDLVESGRLGCRDGQFLTNTSGSVHPINVPFRPKMTCMKYIVVPYGRYICKEPLASSVIYNMSVFDVGNNQSSVLIASLHDLNSETVGDPLGICSETNKMAIEFTVQGYLSVFYFTQETASRSQPRCGGTYVERNGTFTSLNYPMSYNENQVCVYNISVPGARSLCLDIEHLDIGDMDTLLLHVAHWSGPWKCGDGSRTYEKSEYILTSGQSCFETYQMTVYLLSPSNSEPHQGFRATYRSSLETLYKFCKSDDDV